MIYAEEEYSITNNTSLIIKVNYKNIFTNSTIEEMYWKYLLFLQLS